MRSVETVTAQQNNVQAKRGRGRPRLTDEGEGSGLIRGARKKTIDRFIRAVTEAAGGDRHAVAMELEKLLNQRADELESDDEVIERADREITKRREEILRLECVKRAAQQRKEQNNKYTADSPEVVAAIMVQADLVRSDPWLKARFEEFATDDAQAIAKRFPGAHWQSVKHKLRDAVAGRSRVHGDGQS
jgi:hypothetical protein